VTTEQDVDEDTVPAKAFESIDWPGNTSFSFASNVDEKQGTTANDSALNDQVQTINFSLNVNVHGTLQSLQSCLDSCPQALKYARRGAVTLRLCAAVPAPRSVLRLLLFLSSPAIS
jgi:hypothetical protein